MWTPGGCGLAAYHTHLPPEPQGCGAAFSSLMGYQYHQRRCGKPPCEVETPSFPCTHCGKPYRSKAGHDYHVRSEHTAPVSNHSLGARSSGPCPVGSLFPPGGLVCQGNESVMGVCAPSLLSPVFSVWHMPCGSPAHPASPPQPPEEPSDKAPEAEDPLGVERTPSGRIRRTSAQVAVFHLQEIAEDELARDWTKRRMKDDLVPETARVSPPPCL